MPKNDSFFGFTIGMKDTAKRKAEVELTSYYNYNGKHVQVAEFLFEKLQNGYFLEVEKCKYKKQNGEIADKSIYKYYSPNREHYFQLNKMQYNFLKYLIENNLVAK